MVVDSLGTTARVASVPTGVYARISQDRKGDTLGVRRQESACRKLARDRGWDVVDVYVDDDRSAYSGAPRPAYDRLLRDVEIGRIKALVIWHPDRLYRRLVELEAFVTLLERHPIEVGCVQSGDIDLSTANGRLQARVAAIFARHESEHKAERLQAKHQELAERGRWSGGPRPYGYRPCGDGSLEVIPAEEEIIHEMVDRVLSGESIFSICRDLDVRGVPTARGARWRPATLTSLLRGPTIAGQRRWHGQAPTAAVWEPIIDPATSARLRAALDPKRPRGVTPRVNWLSGILVCGECSRPLRGMRRENGKRRFACPPGPSHGGCGRIEVNAEPAERHVLAMMCRVLDSQTLRGRKERASRQSRKQVTDSPEQLEDELVS